MTAAGRLISKAPPRAISIVQDVFPDRHLDTNDMLHRLDRLLFRAGLGPSGVVLVSPPSSPNGVLVNLLAMVKTHPEADGLLECAIAKVVGN
jgi:hypothetical protein